MSILDDRPGHQLLGLGKGESLQIGEQTVPVRRRQRYADLHCARDIAHHAAQEVLVLRARRDGDAHQPHHGPQGLGQVHGGTRQDDGARAIGELLRRLAQEIGHLRRLQIRPEAVEHVQGGQTGFDDVSQSRARILRAVDPGRRAEALETRGAPPDEHSHLHPFGGALRERFRTVLLRSVEQQSAVPGADQELEVVEGIVVHRGVRYTHCRPGAIP